MPRPGVHIVVKKTTKTPFYEILFWHEVTNIAGEIKEYKCIFFSQIFCLKHRERLTDNLQGRVWGRGGPVLIRW